MDKQMGVWTVKLLLIAVLKALVCSLYIVRGVSGIQGSIFVDCGSNASYVDKVTNISWVPDAQYITAGENRYVASAQSIYPNFSEFTTIRYFPDSTAKNCYSFPAITNQTYQIRGTFFYGFYDNAMTTPSFQMGIDGTIVANVTFNDAVTFVYHEFTYVSQPNSNKTFLCLLRDSSNSVPFISAISFSPMPNDFFYGTFPVPVKLYEGHYVQTKYRLNFGGNRFVRYPDDTYDRYWYFEGSNSTFLESTTPPPQILTTNRNIDENKISPVVIPEAVIDTALTTTGENITIIFPVDYTYQAFVIFYYAELDATANATSRQFYIQLPGYETNFINPIVNASQFSVNYQWYLDIPYVAGLDIVLYQDQTIYSPLGPLVNALEVLEISENIMTILTNHEDALAIENIKLSYTNLVNWTGDPCVPTPHPWVTCSTGDNSPIITQVDLSDYNLVGPISPNFGDLLNLVSLALQDNELNGSLPQQLTRLTNLRNLHLQNNMLSGELPAWLASLPSLTESLIQNNNFSGPISPSFISHNGTWTFMYSPGNPMLGLPTSKSTNIGIIIGPIIGGILALVIIIGVIFYFQVQNKHGKTTKTSGHLQMMKSSHQGAKFYSLAEVTIASDNFKTLIGKGGFGHVYYGKLEDGQEVAIKVLDVKSTQGPSEFFNEVHVLSRVSHRNLVSLIGYCHEDNQQMLIYEFMHKGSLRDHLYGDIAMLTVEKLDWKSRMNIALNAAQGLEYLHSGSNQSIIHRDVKSNNILLSSNMEIAKVADFGLSRLIYGKDGITHVTTDVKGTIGYLDPEYFLTEYLSTKSDVYGFGVVLLEIISGRMPIDSTLPNRNAWNLCEWVRSNLQAGNIDRILDPIVKASNPQIDVLWKVAEIAIQCVEPKSIYRPTMTKVVEELRVAILQESLNSSDVNYQWYLDLPYVAGLDIVLYQDQTIYSPLGPLVNALEVLEISENIMTILTNHEDALAIENIKLSYTNLVNWTGDPCVPTPHPWVTCSTGDNPPIITQVDLSDYNLVGPISPNFGDLLNLVSLALQDNELNGSLPQQLTRLTNLRNLHLQNNMLSGELPAWLASLPSLTELLIQNNNFSGPISPSFISHNGTWTFMYSPGNPMLGLPTSKSTNIGIIIGPIIGGILALVIIIGVIFYFQVQNKRGKTTKTSGHLQMMKSSHQGAKFYSLAEVTIASDNFKTLIGKGGFGHVYYGKLEDGQEVAIKVLDVKSTQGPSEFFNEVNVLSRVSHRNLVSLIGYCLEDNQQMLIYEFMHKGSLRDHLYAMLTIGKVDWKSRMNIALNAAQGLEYLHSGSNQSIIHRDVKSSNILLSNNMEIAKVADFGLSRLIYGQDGITHVTTDVKGTAGYLDPEYFLTEYLSPKSDVYGFGVVLLEIISGRMPIDSTLPNRNAWNLCEWVRSNLQAGNIDKILDPIVKASNPQIDVLWKVAEIAIQCVEPKSIHRPTMTKVVEELRAAILQEGLNSSEYSQNDTYGIQDEYGSQINAFDPR
ncbi:unnamed protein product [Sphagnum troendelagicum]